MFVSQLPELLSALNAKISIMRNSVLLKPFFYLLVNLVVVVSDGSLY